MLQSEQPTDKKILQKENAKLKARERRKARAEGQLTATECKRIPAVIDDRDALVVANILHVRSLRREFSQEKDDIMEFHILNTPSVSSWLKKRSKDRSGKKRSYKPSKTLYILLRDGEPVGERDKNPYPKFGPDGRRAKDTRDKFIGNDLVAVIENTPGHIVVDGKKFGQGPGRTSRVIHAIKQLKEANREVETVQ